MTVWNNVLFEQVICSDLLQVPGGFTALPRDSKRPVLYNQV